MRTPHPTLTAIALALTLSACGGGDGNPVAATPGGGTPPVTTPPVTTPPVTTPPVTTPPATVGNDLAAFAVAWASFQMLEAVQALQLTAGGTGNCGQGGTTAYDAASGKQTLNRCRPNEMPYQLYSGSASVSALSANPAHTQVVAKLTAPALDVLDTDGNVEFKLLGGDISGTMTDNGSDDSYFYASNELLFSAGAASKYTVSGAGSTSTVITFVNGKPERSTNNLVYTVSNGSSSWQVTVMAPVHEAGDNRPDRGQLMITRLGATQALQATLGSNGVTLSGGEQNQTQTYGWTDAALRAAIASATQ
ncbi:hypothetical protein FHW58_002856 [Duganella sp. 1224]|uniref:hypothetical protein n=1 Tax=Duganella sp. 1224 TaxID=2587052 RepID=UPI0015CC08A8|nr:hypothetical protein [Duganella sp. 1224]NYE61649.1 hypothetical protein [Duganella sp. 1224]